MPLRAPFRTHSFGRVRASRGAPAHPVSRGVLQRALLPTRSRPAASPRADAVPTPPRSSRSSRREPEVVDDDASMRRVAAEVSPPRWSPRTANRKSARPDGVVGGLERAPLARAPTGDPRHLVMDDGPRDRPSAGRPPADAHSPMCHELPPQGGVGIADPNSWRLPRVGLAIPPLRRTCSRPCRAVASCAR